MDLPMDLNESALNLFWVFVNANPLRNLSITVRLLFDELVALTRFQLYQHEVVLICNNMPDLHLLVRANIAENLLYAFFVA